MHENIKEELKPYKIKNLHCRRRQGRIPRRLIS